MDSAGQGTFSLVGGIIPTAAESAGVRSAEGLVRGVPEKAARDPELAAEDESATLVVISRLKD